MIAGKQFKRRKVVKVTQSPLNALRWCLQLDCGHEIWITSRKRPKRAREGCERCPR